jgi:hypothetical protein
LLDSKPPLVLCFGGDQIRNPFGLSEIEPSIVECSPGELSLFGGPKSGQIT